MDVRGADFIYYQTSDIDRAIEFYRDTLGLEMYGYFEEVKWVEFNAGNATFAVNDPSAFDENAKAQSGGAAVAFAVEDVEENDARAAGERCHRDHPDQRDTRVPLRLYLRPGRQLDLDPLSQRRDLRRLTFPERD